LTFSKQANNFTKNPKADHPVKENMFHLRDFVYLLRFLRKRCSTTQFDGRIDSCFELDGRVLLEGLQRNFGGLDPENFARLVEEGFISSINEALTDYQLDWIELPEGSKVDKVGPLSLILF